MTTKRKITLGIALIGILGLFAFQKLNAEDLSGQMTLGYDSDLHFRGVSDGIPVKHGSIGVSLSAFDHDIELGAIVNVKDNVRDELRFHASTDISILDKVDTSFGIVSYNDNHVVGNASELFVEIGADIVLDPKIKLFYNPGESDITVEGSVSYVVDIGDKIDIGSTAYLGNTVMDDDSGVYYGLNVIGSYSINETVEVFVGLDFTDTSGTRFDTPDVACFAGLNYKY